ncbi:thioredoxin-like protein [Cylindrobasidium torrendii FP15055 ss-10]|uniref:Thioredoxin-like protein n=1 Tax=Cylindrobasidium torrendii FP15055 ss-10 TaxID=1314674 RepID=A0A0D7BM40_9AGAR|nr:thioredoxin-like protein [Cylindrobasidium torrendii FP15055 ss-10]
MTIQKITLDITSDSICPWCCIGFKHVQQAIKQIRAAGHNVEFEIEFHPFMLDSSLPTSPGYNKRAWYASRLGASRIKAAEEQMVALGMSEGVRLNYDGQVSNTLDSHRLVAKALEVGGQNAQVKVMEAFWSAYLERADDIGDREILATEMEKLGLMSKAEVFDFLGTSENKNEVQQYIQDAQLNGVAGVPYTLINKKYALTGAQPTSSFHRIFSEIVKGQRK